MSFGIKTNLENPGPGRCRAGHGLMSGPGLVLKWVMCFMPLVNIAGSRKTGAERKSAMLPRRAPAAAVALVMAVAGFKTVLAAEDPVVATVNGVEIHLTQAKDAYQRLPEQYRQAPFEAIFSGLVDSLIDSKLAAEDAKRQKVPDEPEFKARMARIEEQVLQRMVLSRAMKAGVTDADVRARYETMIKGMAGNEQIQARHILLETEDAAKAVIADLKKGRDFASLARERSTGPSASEGGDLGFFAKGQMVPAFEKATFGLAKGQYTETPVKTQFGWHVIKLEDRKKASVPKFEEVEQDLRNDLSQEVGTVYVNRLRKAAKINRFNADGSPLDGADPKAVKTP